MKNIKLLIFVISVIAVCTQAVHAQKTGQVVKQVERKVVAGSLGEQSSKAAVSAAVSAADNIGKAVLEQSQKNIHKVRHTQEQEDALLRGRLLGDEAFPSPMILRKTQARAQKQVKNAPVTEDLTWVPAKRLATEKRRLNIPLATSLLMLHKESIIKAYSLTDSFLEGYYLRRIYPYMNKPAFAKDKSGHMFRGIFMTVDELASTLQNGFLTSMNTWNVGAKNKGDKFISFSTSTGEAQSYIFQGDGNGKHPYGIGVVFEVEPNLKGLEFWKDEKLNSTNTIYHCYQDVPAEKILNVYIYGEYGLENLAEVLIKARNKTLTSRERWIHQFDYTSFMR